MRCLNTILILLMASLGLQTSCSREQKSVYRIAAASSLVPLADELAGIFTDLHPDFTLEWTFGASGILAQHIINGAQYDAFISADKASILLIEGRGMLDGQAVPFAEGRLVLFVRHDSAIPYDGLWEEAGVSDLLMAYDGSIVIPGPDSAPYGRAAREALMALNVWEALQDRLVQARGVSQAVQFVSTAAGMGFLSQGSMQDSRLIGQWVIIDTTLYSAVVHYAVALDQSKQSCDSADKLTDFILDQGFQAILENAGYILVN